MERNPPPGVPVQAMMPRLADADFVLKIWTRSPGERVP
jgi:hypothetical protein